MKTCPNCGYDFARNEPFKDGNWLVTSTRTFWKDVQVPLTAQQAEMVFAVAKAHPQVIRNEAVIAKLGLEDVKSPENQLSVVYHRARKALMEYGCPVDRQHGVGFYWSG